MPVAPERHGLLIPKKCRSETGGGAIFSKYALTLSPDVHTAKNSADLSFIFVVIRGQGAYYTHMHCMIDSVRAGQCLCLTDLFRRPFPLFHRHSMKFSVTQPHVQVHNVFQDNENVLTLLSY